MRALSIIRSLPCPVPNVPLARQERDTQGAGASRSGPRPAWRRRRRRRPKKHWERRSLSSVVALSSTLEPSSFLGLDRFQFEPRELGARDLCRQRESETNRGRRREQAACCGALMLLQSDEKFGRKQKSETLLEVTTFCFRKESFGRELTDLCAQFRRDAPRREKPRALPRTRRRVAAPGALQEVALFATSIVTFDDVDYADTPTTHIGPSFFFAPAILCDCRRWSRHADRSSSSSSIFTGNDGREPPRGPRPGPRGPSPRRIRPRPKANAAADAIRLDGADEARLRAPRRSRREGARVNVRVRRDCLRL